MQDEMNDIAPQALTLDHNEQLPVRYEDNPSGNRFAIDLSSLARPEVLGNEHGHFQQGMKLSVNGATLPITPYFDKEAKTLNFEGTFPKHLQRLQLSLYGQPILNLAAHDNALVLSPEHAHERLSVDDLRMLATSDIRQEHLPANRTLFRGFDPKKHAPITDLHTHSSAQLSNADLMDISIKHHLDYPVELLQKLGIKLNEDERAAVKEKGGLGSRFSPLEHEEPRLQCEIQNEKIDVIPLEKLSGEHKQRVQEQLQIPQDMTLSFSDFDRQYYRFVNPLVKNPAITKDMLLAIARNYQKQGVKYAELSTASMLNLDAQGQATWFKEMIEAVDEAEKETGVKLRFLIGVPRSYGPTKVMAELEKIKYAARHPLIVGVDLLGYESNPTSNFSGPLSHIADWASAPEGTDLKGADGWDFKRDFTIRIHAGETAKNDGNVAEAVNIAERFGVKVRIAHAVNEGSGAELDKRIKRLSSTTPPLVSMEFCPSSNIAYNNIQDVKEVPFQRWLKCCKNWFLGTDGAGAIQTTPTQLALAALSTGHCSLKQLEEMRAGESRFIEDANRSFDAKMAAFNRHYGAGGQDPNAAFLKGLAEHVQQVNDLIDPKKLDPIHPKLPTRFEGKMPILVAGASGDSFALINKKSQNDIRQAMHMLVASTDPQKAYFVVGRSKSEGVTAALDEAIMEHNASHPTNKFNVLALLTEDIPDLPRSIGWVVQQKGKRDNVPDNIIKFMRGNLGPDKIPGISIFIGGSNYTSDMIKKCRGDEGLAYLLMEGAEGASAKHALKVHAQHRFSNGKSLITRIMDMFGDRGALRDTASPVRAGIDSTQLDTLAADATKAVESFAIRARKSLLSSGPSDRQGPG